MTAPYTPAELDDLQRLCDALEDAPTVVGDDLVTIRCEECGENMWWCAGVRPVPCSACRLKIFELAMSRLIAEVWNYREALEEVVDCGNCFICSITALKALGRNEEAVKLLAAQPDPCAECAKEGKE